MGYHISIVRTGVPQKTINQEELVSVVEGQFQFTLQRDGSGTIKQAFREVSGEEVLLFYDGTEIWTKNPSDTVLKIMIDIAQALGNKARVRGDEGETYKSITKTYNHPDDANLRKKERPLGYWINKLSLAVVVFIGLSFVYVFGKLLIRYLKNKYGFGF